MGSVNELRRFVGKTVERSRNNNNLRDRYFVCKAGRGASAFVVTLWTSNDVLKSTFQRNYLRSSSPTSVHTVVTPRAGANMRISPRQVLRLQLISCRCYCFIPVMTPACTPCGTTGTTTAAASTTTTNPPRLPVLSLPLLLPCSPLLSC